ncbi:hypothetical protein KY290_025201 [Solanum tuberosum]|uniref:Retroviral polymerase SH3-like domain-containing protein n=1 Tax=Solanum tuberosum TaxID=4113 RepID=A0ABQ7USY7_SOLTU|nr:hypothetical protein KY284_024007 [Solanum tuberosum]KAH0754931.1 hypothetical protein KY290_025201 [Solanum tuberosum]
MSPYERLYKVAPDYTLLKVFGSSCFVLLQPHEHPKLEPRAQVCFFLGYGIEYKGSSSESDIAPNGSPISLDAGPTNGPVHESSTTSNSHDQSPIDSYTLDMNVDFEVPSSSLLPNNTSSIRQEREKKSS